MKTENNKKVLTLPLVTFNDLHNNELCKLVLMLSCRIFKKKKRPNEIERYVLDVFDIINNIQEGFTNINRAKGFIQRRPNQAQLDSNEEMTVPEYYMYHYDVVIHKLSTIRDLSYKLINAIFKLDLDERNCNWNGILKRKEKISALGIMNLMQLYYAALYNIETQRNVSTHSGKLELQFLKYIDYCTFISKAIRLYGFNCKDPMAKRTYNQYVLRKNKKQLLEHIDLYQNASMFFIHALTCCLKRTFYDNLSDDFKTEYSAEIGKAEELVDRHERKFNRLIHIFDCLITLDKRVKDLSEKNVKIGGVQFKYF